MTRRCDRTWEVGAARDGRLGAKVRLDLERHLAHCDDCASEEASLDTLGDRLRSLAVAEPNDLGLRRLRGRTLEAADAAALQRATRSRTPKAVLGLAAVAVAFGLLVAFRHAPSRPADTSFVVTDEGGAHWSAHEAASVRHIDLRSGALAVAVARPAGGKRVIVHMPDGEIEDVGTLFHVGVVDGHTRRVHVDEGIVVVRIDGQPERLLHAGESWDAPTTAARTAASPTPSEGAPAPGEARSEPAVAAPVAPTAKSSASAAPNRSPVPPPSVERSSADASDDEDRAYVEIVRLLREGRQPEAKSAARKYLRRFPSGFRRTEVERVLAAP